MKIITLISFILLSNTLISCKNAVSDTRKQGEPSTVRINDLLIDDLKGAVKTEIEIMYMTQPYKKFDDWYVDDTLNIFFTKTEYDRFGNMMTIYDSSILEGDINAKLITKISSSSDSTDLKVTSNKGEYLGRILITWNDSLTRFMRTINAKNQLINETRTKYNDMLKTNQTETISYSSNGKRIEHTIENYSRNASSLINVMTDVLHNQKDTSEIEILSRDKKGNPIRQLLKTRFAKMLYVTHYEYYN